MLEVKALSFGFDRPLVSGLSFTVLKGRITLFHGPSGCGKSTLLALISGTASESVNWDGSIRLGDVDIGGLPPHKRSVGLMYQDALLFPHLNVGDNLAFGLSPSVRGKERDMMVEAVSYTHLTLPTTPYV